ncbi:hypothetical protein Tco_1145467 [Tanacetum coccineum]
MSNSNTNLQTQTSNALHNAIMEAGAKDRPPMLAPSNYVQWKSRIKRYIVTKPNNELIHYCLQNPPYKFKWTEKTVPVAEGSSETTTEGYMENYKNVSQDIRDQLNAEAEAVQIILTGIDNDIYSIVDACPNACEMWKAIERLKQGESINVQDLETNLYWEFRKFTSRDGESLESYYSRFYKMMNELVRNKCDVTNHQVNVQFLLQLQPEWQRFVTLVKQSQELKTVSYHKLYDILKQHHNEVNEIRAERLARTANPLALVAQQQQNRGKAIVTSSAPIYDQEPTTVTKDDEMSKEKEIDKLMALISLSFKKIYKHTNNNLQTSSNTSRANQENSPRINKGTGYDNQRVVNVAGARENVVKDATYHKEKMLLYKQAKAGVQLNAEKTDWKDDTDDESDDQELEAHYMYMAQIQKVTPDAVDNFRPIFDDEPLHKVQNNNDNYNVFAIENEHHEQPESVNDIYLAEQGDTNITIDSLDICYDRDQDNQDDTDELDQEHNLLASLIEKLKYEIDDSKNNNKFLETSNKALVDKLKGEIEDFKTKNKCLESSNNHFKEANNELSKTNQLMFKDLKKFQAKLDKYHDVNYASKVAIDCAKAKGDLIFAKPEFLKKAQRANPRMYDIGCYNDNLALMLAPDSDETIRLEKECRSKLSDLIRPFDYDQLNNIYDLVVPQREKSAEQHYFPKTSKMSHTSSNKEFSKESFCKQTTLLEKRMDESIPWDQKCKSSKELFKIKKSVDTSFDGVERCKQTIARRTYFGQTRESFWEDRVMSDNSLRDRSRSRRPVGCLSSRGTDLYSHFSADSTYSNPFCLMAKRQNSSQDGYGIIMLFSCELGKAKRKSFHTMTTPSSKTVTLYTWTYVVQCDETPGVLIDFLNTHLSRGLRCSSYNSSNWTKDDHTSIDTLFNTSTLTLSTQLSVHLIEIIQAETNSENAQFASMNLVNIFQYHRYRTRRDHVSSLLISQIEYFLSTPSFCTTLTNDHPLEQVMENPSQSVRTRRQLETDGEMCMFALTVSRTEPKNIKEAMADSAWIESMQEELYQFDRLE